MRRAARARGAAAGLAALALGAGCFGPGDFVCHSDEQCGTTGFCEANGRCSTFDPGCASRRRYLASAGDVSNACVATSCGGNPIATLTSGGSHSCVLRQGGGVTCWGLNADGQLGDGTLTPRASGVSVAGLDDAIALAAGERHTCAVRTGGAVVCWGADDTGQLGDGGGPDRPTPVPVGGVAGATAVAAGAGFTCALLADRSVICWGDDSDGEIGDGAAAASPRPPTAVVGLSNVRVLSAHWQHACAVRTDGSLVCWGSNTSGQLGDGTLINRPQPTPVPDVQNVVTVTTGLSHTCAMMAGAISCWGSNSQGQLGSNNGGATAPVTAPLLVPIVTDPIAIAAGAQHTCAVRLNGQVLCWGQNSTGQLGEGSMSSLAEPVPVTNLSGGRLVAAGATFSCAVTGDGAVFCWGDDHDGQLGTGHDVVQTRPVIVPGRADGIAAGGAHTCAVGRGATADSADAFVCWGSDQAGQLGDNGDDDRAQPGPIELPLAPRAIAAGALHSCAVDSSAALWCWGRGSSGQLGPGHLVDTPFPVQVALPTGTSAAVAPAAGDAHSCVLVSPADGLGDEILCFGDNSHGQLGDGTLTGRATPAAAPLGAAGTRASAVVAGGAHTCALDVDGQIWCWGRGDSGQIGDGAAVDRPTPTVVPLPSGTPAAALAAGAAHTCAVDQMGTVYCWGANDRGQLGLGAAGANLPTPTALAPLAGPAAGVSAGGAHTCATVVGGAIWCWGANESGQLGDGTTIDRATPVAVAGATGTVSAGGSHTCAATADHIVRCWGADTSGQLGDGVTLTISAPELARLACD